MRLVKAINSLTQIQGAEVHCPINGDASIQLQEASGHPIQVYAARCPGVTIENFPTLVDTNGVVWKTVQAIVRKHRAH